MSNHYNSFTNKKPQGAPKAKFNNNNNQNNNNNKKTSDKSAYVVVVSDSSEYVEQKEQERKEREGQLIGERQPGDVSSGKNQSKGEEQQGGLQVVEERPIRERTYEERLNIAPIESKPAKKIKLAQDSPVQQVRIIRFGAAKTPSLQQPQQQLDLQKLQHSKQKKAHPWLSKSTKQIEDACLRFHNETVEFYEYIRPSKKQHETRLQVFNMVADMIVEKYPQAKVEYFGSFATKLYLPDGDIDVTVLIDDIQEYMERGVYDTIYKIIRKNEGIAFCDIQYIRHSKVPLIKFVHIDTQLPFDVSVNKRDGLFQIEHVQRMKKLYPQFEPLVFVFKTALKIRNLSQTYTGGIGSFLLFCMILHFLRYVHKKEYYYTMGEYVMKFMEFYAISGDWERKSIYVADGTEVGRAREPGTLSFFSPQDDSHDIGKSAYKIRDSFNVFKNRFRVIAGKNFKEGESILKELVNPSGEEFRYYKYEKAMNKKVE